MFCSDGILRYSPKLVGETSEKWWVVLDCDPAIGEYYRWLYHMESHQTRRLMRPAWKEHITVIRNEEPPDSFKHLWEDRAGQKISFSYEHQIRDDGLFFWIDVQCSELLDFREELGLPRNPEYSLHLTIGNLKNGV